MVRPKREKPLNKDELAREIKKLGRYANVKKFYIYGHTFDSKAEMQRYLELRLLRRAGVIRDLELQVRIPIILGGVEVRYPPTPRNKKGRQMVYVADFRYMDIENDCVVVEDVKMASRFRPEIYKFKRALIHSMGITILETH